MKEAATTNAVRVPVYLEVGASRTFAGSIDWPGWCRNGRNEELALQVLLKYGQRYTRALGNTQFGFRAPNSVLAFNVIERLPGNATTDFGAPSLAPAADAIPLDDASAGRLVSMLNAFWDAFDAAVRAGRTGAGKELRRGPRGGGRDLEEIVQHVVEADTAYLAKVGKKPELDRDASSGPGEVMKRCRQAITDVLVNAPRGLAPEHGPRGGIRWTPRYFARRVAWHSLDHAWEIEDRLN